MLRSASIPVVLVVLAGCLGATPLEPTVSGTGNAAPDDAPRLDLSGTGCAAAGGVGQNPRNPGAPDSAYGVPEPFKMSDTWEYVEAPPGPIASIGNLHMGLVCETWTISGVHTHMPSVGLIALVVEPPPFEGIEPVERNFLLSTLATHDEGLTRAIDGLGFYVYPGTARLYPGAVGGDVSPRFFDGEGAWDVTATVETAGDGIYKSGLTLREKGATWDTLRFWIIAAGEDGLLHPVALDLRLSSGSTYIGTGTFSHLNTGKHAGDRADRYMGGVGFQMFDLSADLTWVEGEVSGMWDH